MKWVILTMLLTVAPVPSRESETAGVELGRSDSMGVRLIGGRVDHQGKSSLRTFKVCKTAALGEGEEGSLFSRPTSEVDASTQSGRSTEIAAIRRHPCG